MPVEQVFTNARVVLRDHTIHGCVVLRDGRIHAVDEAPSHSPGALDLEGDLLLPGLVELHTDHLESHLSPRPNVHWPPLAALLAHDGQMAASGITTVLDAICLGVYEERQEFLSVSIQAIHDARAGGLLRADHFLHLRCEVVHPQLMDFFTPFATDPLLRLVSLMDHTPGQRQWRDLDKYRAYYGWRYKLDRAGLDRLIDERMNTQELHAAEHSAQVAALCNQQQISLASHDDTDVAHVAEACALGVSISEFPTTHEAAVAARQAGMGIIMGSPNLVLGGSHSGNVAALHLAEHRLLDALASDYVPISLLEGALHLCTQAGFTMAEAVATVTRNPARMVGLKDRGEIAVGLRADLLRVRPVGNVPWIRGVWREGVRIG